MRKWLALTVSVPFVALMWAGCNGGDDTGDAGDAAPAQDAKSEKKPLPESGPQDTGPTCAPSSTVDSQQITWVPPISPNPNACSDAQVQAFFDDCFGQNATSQKCQGFINSSANATCFKCLSTTQGADNAYGVLIAIGSIDYPNVSGCIALLTNDTSNTGCGAKQQAVIDCDSLACQANCPKVVDKSTLTQYDQCATAAEGSVCKSYVDALCDLSEAGAVYSTCINHSDFQSAYFALAPVFCGAYPADAGTDAGPADGSADSMSGDAADDGAADAPNDGPDAD